MIYFVCLDSFSIGTQNKVIFIWNSKEVGDVPFETNNGVDWKKKKRMTHREGDM